MAGHGQIRSDGYWGYSMRLNGSMREGTNAQKGAFTITLGCLIPSFLANSCPIQSDFYVTNFGQTTAFFGRTAANAY